MQAHQATRAAALMHVTAVLDAIKKRGHFEHYDKAALKYKEARKAIESAEGRVRRPRKARM